MSMSQPPQHVLSMCCSLAQLVMIACCRIGAMCLSLGPSFRRHVTVSLRHRYVRYVPGAHPQVESKEGAPKGVLAFLRKSVQRVRGRRNPDRDRPRPLAGSADRLASIRSG